jgi:hypothetical protein
MGNGTTKGQTAKAPREKLESSYPLPGMPPGCDESVG